jgi:putative intracellular protease/amidase
LHAQRKVSSARPYGRQAWRPAPVRARIGLAMRRSMSFGHMGEAEGALRAQGLSLAPMAMSDGPISDGGVMVMPTATVEHLSDGSLKALVVPAGAPEADLDVLRDMVGRAHAAGIPIFAFGEGVAAALKALDRAPAAFATTPGVMIQGDEVLMLSDVDALTAAAARVG